MPFFQAITEIQAEIDQGDVFSDIYFSAIDARVNAVVITPTCDLVQNKAFYIKFIAAVSLELVIKIIADSIGIEESLFHSENQISRTKHLQMLKMLRRNTTGDFLPRFYLMPKYGEILPASYLDFQKVFILPYAQVEDEYQDNRVAKICTPWRESITSQYAGYSMRIGTPDYTDDELSDILTMSGLRFANDDVQP